MFEKLKSAGAVRLDLDEIVAILAFARLYRSELAERELDDPEWLPLRVRELESEVAGRIRDRDEKRLLWLRGVSERLKPTDQKRRETSREIARLERKLGTKGAAA